MAELKLTDNQKEDIQKFLISRFDYLRSIRSELDDEVKKEVDIYNNIDANIRSKEEDEEKYEIPYVYTIVNTIVARIQNSVFGKSNYVKIHVESDNLLKYQKELTHWMQNELDRLKLKKRSRDFVEDACVKRMSWLQLRPVGNSKEEGQLNIEFDALDFYDVWFDLKAKDVMDTDFFVRKVQKFHKVRSNDVYFDTEGLADYDGQDEDHQIRRDKYSATNSSTDNLPEYQKFTVRNNATDEVELMEWYGEYDLSDEDISDPNYKGDFKEVIFTLANRATLIRAEINDIPTKRKRLLFPIRPLRQANSLVGKGIPQLTRGMAEENNEIRSLRLQNVKQLVKLLWKYDRTANIDLEELHSGAGNAVGYDGLMNKDALSLLPVPNLIRETSLMIQDGMQDMQQTTGAVDHVMGTTAARGLSDTATGTQAITEQAMFKFSMMTDNIYDDLVEMINFVAILHFLYAKESVELRHPKLAPGIFSVLPVDLENNYFYDIELKDISQRRDLEQHQWANMIGILGPMVQQVGGNLSELLSQFMDVFQIPNKDKILQPESPQAIAMKMIQNPALAQQVQAIMASVAAEDAGKGGGQSPAVPAGGSPQEQAGNTNLPV